MQIHQDPLVRRLPVACDNRRLGQLLPSLVEEFDGRRSAEQIRACADAVLTRYDDAPVRSFLLTLADRATRECLQADRCYELVR